MAFDITTVAGQGTENLDSGSSLPFIRILQDLSPQLKKQKDEYIEGAESGDLFFAKTQSVLEQPVEIVPCYTKSIYTEWIPRSKGGGFVGNHPLTVVSNPAYEKGRERQYDEWLGDNELKFTTYWFVLMKVNDSWEQAVIPFTSSQLRVSRKLTQDINRFRYDDASIAPPLFAQSWKLKSVLETSKNGDDYYNFDFVEPKVLDFEDDESILSLASDTYKTASDTPLLQTEEKPQLVDSAAMPY
jgi:hypothetical protein|tara:strand:- start:1056 stop:1784 length:729 start_codon:yes stop_codon:yes gene_type:complete